MVLKPAGVCQKRTSSSSKQAFTLQMVSLSVVVVPWPSKEFLHTPTNHGGVHSVLVLLHLLRHCTNCCISCCQAVSE